MENVFIGPTSEMQSPSAPCIGPAIPPQGWERAEPLHAWRFYSALADDTLHLAVEVSNLIKQTSARELRTPVLSNAVLTSAHDDPRLAAHRQYNALYTLMNWWLRRGAVGLVIPEAWPNFPPRRIMLGGQLLFGAIATRLAAAVYQADHLGICTHCGEVQFSESRPRSDRLWYCSQCHERDDFQMLAERHGKAERRQRSRAK